MPDTAKMKSLVSNKTQAIYDYQFWQTLTKISFSSLLEEPPGLLCRQDYLAQYHQLIHQTKLNELTGLERFSERHLINGTTQSFDEAYHRYAHRRLRLFRGEYAYHKRINPDFAFLEDESLKENDYIIVSLPFCSTGDVHPYFQEVLDEALRLEVPVEVDCAYIGTCWGIEADLGHPAIKAVSFSLTKGMGLGNIRSGIRYSDYRDSFPICQQNDCDHTVLLAARVGLYMMERFNLDHIPKRFKEAQESVCYELGLKPTKCMHLSLGEASWGNKYRVDQRYYRLGIRELVKARHQGKI